MESGRRGGLGSRNCGVEDVGKKRSSKSKRKSGGVGKNSKRRFRRPDPEVRRSEQKKVREITESSVKKLNVRKVQERNEWKKARKEVNEKRG